MAQKLVPARAETGIEERKKKRKVSKKTKKSWRKHVDTKDVDSFLESSRLEERLGVPFTERSDQDLFVVDSTPTVVVSEVAITKRERREALRNAEPRCYASLKPHTAVPDPIAKRNRVKTPEERKNPITKRLENDRKLSGQMKLKEKIAVENKKFAAAKRAARPKRGEFEGNIWEDGNKPILPGVDSQWLTSDTVRHTLANRGIRKKRIPTSVHKKPSALPAVDIPHPGTSYNPSYEDHQQLLREVAQQELQLMKEEAHLNRVTTKMFQKVSVEQRNKDWLKESSEGLPKPGQKKANEDAPTTEDDSTVKSVNPPVKNAKKTLVQRRKQKEQRRLALKIKHAKVEKKKVSDIYKLKALRKHLATKDQKVELLREKRQKVKERKATQPKTLSRVKFEPSDPVFKLGEELTGNLRNTDPTGNLLKDRYKSLQQRSILAPTTRVLKINKAKVKRFEKADHKMGWEGTFK